MTDVAVSRREWLQVVAVSTTSVVCASCASNPFFDTISRPPAADELLTFAPARRSRAEVVKLDPQGQRQVLLRQRYLKLVAGRQGSDSIVGEKFAFMPREHDGGVSVAELKATKLAALLSDPRVKQESTPNLLTMIGRPAYYISGGQVSGPDLPLVTMTPWLLPDGKLRIAFASDDTAARLTQPFELDLERDRWYAILLDVWPVDKPAASREHLCCLRIELPERPPVER